MRISDWSSDVCSSDLVAASAVGSGVEHLDLPELDNGPLAGSDHARHQGVGSRLDAAVATDPRGGVRLAHDRDREALEIGRASWRERVCQYVEITVVAVSIKKQKNIQRQETTIR